MKDDFVRKFQILENKTFQMKQATYTNVKRKYSEFQEDMSYLTEIKRPSFDGKQYWSTDHKQFETAATVGDGRRQKRLALSF